MFFLNIYPDAQFDGKTYCGWADNKQTNYFIDSFKKLQKMFVKFFSDSNRKPYPLP